MASDFNSGGGSRPPQPPRGIRPEMPDFSRMRLPVSVGRGILLGALALIVLWAATGIYSVQTGEQGVVRRFGEVVAITQPGLHYHWPAPIETVVTPKVTEVRRIEIGFRTIDVGPPARYQDIPHETKMLTRDENIVDAEIIIQYKIGDAEKFLFNVRNPEQVLRHGAEAALRDVVGRTTIDEVLTTGKARIQVETKDLLQGIVDDYGMGVIIIAVQLQDVHPPEEVSQAFKDVASAKEDKSRLINEAQGYYNELIPRARGESAAIIREAEGYAQARVARAQGDVSRFEAMLAEYENGNQEVTRTRLYLELMEEILPDMKVLIVADSDGVLKFLPINEYLTGGGGR